MYVLEAGPTVLCWAGSLLGIAGLRGTLSTYRKSTSAKIITEQFSSSRNRTSLLACVKCITIITEIALPWVALSCTEPPPGARAEARPLRSGASSGAKALQFFHIPTDTCYFPCAHTRKCVHHSFTFLMLTTNSFVTPFNSTFKSISNQRTSHHLSQSVQSKSESSGHLSPKLLQ